MEEYQVEWRNGKNGSISGPTSTLPKSCSGQAALRKEQCVMTPERWNNRVRESDRKIWCMGSAVPEINNDCACETKQEIINTRPELSEKYDHGT
jgi:hypothetical protein